MVISDTTSIIKDELDKGNVVTVTFTKTNGDQRVMRCTTSTTLIPTDMLPKSGNTTNTNSDVAKVFDLDISQWRSFRFDSVTKVTV